MINGVPLRELFHLPGGPPAPCKQAISNMRTKNEPGIAAY